eukprot:COSAG03_NODE_3133_length_2190_cov_1.018651_3_plen_76_part_01
MPAASPRTDVENCGDADVAMAPVTSMAPVLLCAAVLSLCSHGVHAGSRWASAPVREGGEPPYPFPSDRKYNTGACA